MKNQIEEATRQETDHPAFSPHFASFVKLAICSHFFPFLFLLKGHISKASERGRLTSEKDNDAKIIGEKNLKIKENSGPHSIYQKSNTTSRALRS